MQAAPKKIPKTETLEAFVARVLPLIDLEKVSHMMDIDIVIVEPHTVTTVGARI